MKKPNPVWTDDKVHKLRISASFHTLDELAKKFDVTYASVKNACYAYHIPFVHKQRHKVKPWSDSKIQLLEDMMVSRIPYSAICEKFNLTVGGIRYRCNKYGIPTYRRKRD